MTERCKTTIQQSTPVVCRAQSQRLSIKAIDRQIGIGWTDSRQSVMSLRDTYGLTLMIIGSGQKPPTRSYHERSEASKGQNLWNNGSKLGMRAQDLERCRSASSGRCGSSPGPIAPTGAWWLMVSRGSDWDFFLQHCTLTYCLHNCVFF